MELFLIKLYLEKLWNINQRSINQFYLSPVVSQSSRWSILTRWLGCRRHIILVFVVMELCRTWRWRWMWWTWRFLVIVETVMMSDKQRRTLAWWSLGWSCGGYGLFLIGVGHVQVGHWSTSSQIKWLILNCYIDWFTSWIIWIYTYILYWLITLCCCLGVGLYWGPLNCW